ncbi:aldo/keto reductase [Streptomyces iconiensis]|uniref:Aldo/keto reductase n=1 Tax=Streptomyces iconiensis TaxID=1384038 RepID=A0ABT6ZZE0_9ACTN|nr:aldo/keto reductase [Streptomyces iconiensis]MDJ1134434.1 aldo/keto reductase [Streptomyces iconiensis]
MTSEPHSRRLGDHGPTVTSPALGCLGLSGGYGPTDDAQGIRTLHTYLDAGGTLLDTGDFYGSGHNEWLIRQALSARNRDAVTLSVKFGSLRGPGGTPGGNDGRPEAVRNFLSYSLQRLGVDHLDIYRPARLDPAVPIEETVGAVAEMVEKGYVRHIGLSEVGTDTIRRAAAVAPISDVQIEYSLLSREVEDGILPVCRELGIGITAYGVLSSGLIGGSSSTGGKRAYFPRFQGANLEHNAALVAGLEKIAAEKNATLAQLAVAWVAAQGDDVVPVVGARRPDQVGTLLDSTRLPLTSDDLTRIEALVPRGAARGERYPAALMAELDSER